MNTDVCPIEELMKTFLPAFRAFQNMSNVQCGISQQLRIAMSLLILGALKTNKKDIAKNQSLSVFCYIQTSLLPPLFLK